MNTKIKISDEKIEPENAIKFVSNSRSGAVDLFLGTIRNHNEGKSVQKLEYHIYDEMVKSEIEKIAGEARSKWEVEKIYIEHRTGEIRIEEIAVAIAVSSVHRSESFDACRYLIDNIKHRGLPSLPRRLLLRFNNLYYRMGMPAPLSVTNLLVFRKDA